MKITPQYNTPPVQVTNNVRDGDQFLLITKSRNGQTQIWGSNEEAEGRSLYTSVSSAFEKQTEPTS